MSNQRDMYRICCLVNLGWKLDWNGIWRKDGAIRSLSYAEKDSNDYALRNGFTAHHDGTDFTLEEAADYEGDL